MALATVVSLLLKEHSKGKDIIEFIGTPGTAMLISLLLPLYGYARKISIQEISRSMSESICKLR
ncbi:MULTISPECIES: hypothetical protein [Bacillus]|uniref:GntT/GntP/DsdX family permease n=1 Tax=Bacillus TaxID=1386 RepID=UPI0020D12E95|nr:MULTISPECIES: hypothetical protein [Bacillus]WGE37194.1 hypothetical protein QA442_12020 [Bacillus stercoris]